MTSDPYTSGADAVKASADLANKIVDVNEPWYRPFAELVGEVIGIQKDRVASKRRMLNLNLLAQEVYHEMQLRKMESFTREIPLDIAAPLIEYATLKEITIFEGVLPNC